MTKKFHETCYIIVDKDFNLDLIEVWKQRTYDNIEKVKEDLINAELRGHSRKDNKVIKLNITRTYTEIKV